MEFNIGLVAGKFDIVAATVDSDLFEVIQFLNKSNWAISLLNHSIWAIKLLSKSMWAMSLKIKPPLSSFVFVNLLLKLRLKEANTFQLYYVL